MNISTERKTRARIRGENPSILALSVYNKGLGLAHNAFDQANTMLALLSKSKFSAKDITLFCGLFYFLKKTIDLSDKI